ncbi:MAG TPA: DUF3558 domain-containing protein [Actinophytocola sp.]|uniref:DUF3558 domain-containing protein n=1 Tax=Actinophytocola sp. TaxID=1872138 RepID=UPI002E05275B|nr:DUF3558 domain-containing protein [Actinophytocola sp.]
MIALIIGGCSTTANGVAIPATTTPTAERSSDPSNTNTPTKHGAPKVTVPLDVSTFLAQPCATLSPTQLRELNLPAQGEPDTDSAIAKNVGPGCMWTNSVAGNTVGVSFISGNPHGLDDLYRGHEQGQFDGYWIETTVEGYPAVFHDATDGRRSGQCNIAIGASDTLAFRIGEHGELKEKSCDRAKLIASAVVQTLKGGR